MTKCSINTVKSKISPEVIFSNLELLLANKNYIISSPKYYYIRIEKAFLGGAKLCEFFLGDLLKLWSINYEDMLDKGDFWASENGFWLRKIGDEIAYVYQVNGSPLSGSCYAKIYNSKAKTFDTLKGSALSKYCQFAGDIIKDRPPLFNSNNLFEELLLKI